MSEEKMGQIIVQAIQYIVFILPVVGLIWKMASIHAKIERHTVDINNLGMKARNNDELNEKHYSSLMEKFNKIELVLAEFGASMKHLRSDIDELKIEIKELR